MGSSMYGVCVQWCVCGMVVCSKSQFEKWGVKVEFDRNGELVPTSGTVYVNGVLCAPLVLGVTCLTKGAKFDLGVHLQVSAEFKLYGYGYG